MGSSTPTSSQEGREGACDTLYYDGRCPLCAAEIESLRETRGDQLKLVDIHADSARAGVSPDVEGNTEGTSSASGTPAATKRPSRDDLLRTLHLRRADGRWLRGADANVAAWNGTRRGRFLSALRWPLVRHVVDLGYAIWAWWRYRRLYGAQYREELHAPRS